MVNKCSVIIPAAGQGKRMRAELNKQFLQLQGMPIIVHTLRAFQRCRVIDEIILVVGPGEEPEYRNEYIPRYGLDKIKAIVEGGRERQDSVINGLQAVSEDCDIVLVHDGARPLVTDEEIINSVTAAEDAGAAVVAVPVKDTIKKVGSELLVEKTLERGLLWQAQTPQTFRYEVFCEATRRAREDGFYGTDDTSLVERLGRRVKIVQGSYENLKITTPEDLILAEAIIKRRGSSCGRD